MKNFKLLLASTAILSTGLAMNVKADEPVINTDTVHATLSATIGIYEPFTISNGLLDFGFITTSGRANKNIIVKVNPDGTIDHQASTAQVMGGQRVSPMYMTGGMASDSYSIANSMRSNAQAIIDAGTEGGYSASDISEATATVTTMNSFLNGTYSSLSYGVFSLVLDGNGTFDLKRGGYTDGDVCGTVSELMPTWKVNNVEGKELEIRFGGKFTLDNDFNPEGGYNYCSGSTTVTVVRNRD